MKLRGYVALAVVCLGLLLSDPVQRFVITPWVRLRPSRRAPVLTSWINFMARVVTRPIVRIGGAHIPVPDRVVPAEPGVLILMNHQSLFDIPLLVQSVEDGYPRIVTRKRYGRWIPQISQMTRLYQYPLVDPSANAGAMRRTYKELRDAARTSDVPIAVFPEGSRSRDGHIRRFRTKGVSLLLRARPWKVYVLVADGFWQKPRFKDFLKGMDGIHGDVALAGVLDWDDPRADPAAFLEEVRALMERELARMRAEGQPA
ncbi:MAG: 1-acyl-sn-glycerol-3-phosphate acyltransferase [Gemmatimonadota bacterium]|nr:1-acyl-sn-glycerol-3-phosphate acyltransferase [Gemmatimonadota bacterium]